MDRGSGHSGSRSGYSGRWDSLRCCGIGWSSGSCTGRGRDIVNIGIIRLVSIRAVDSSGEIVDIWVGTNGITDGGWGVAGVNCIHFIAVGP